MNNIPTFTSYEYAQLVSLKGEIQRKLYLAKTSFAGSKGTNSPTISKRQAQLDALTKILRNAPHPVN